MPRHTQPMIQRGRLLVLLAATAWSLAPLSAVAQAKSETPQTLAGGKVISVDDGKALLAKKTAMFVDTRSAVNFGKGHVPGAVAIPYKGSSDDVASFDASKDQFDLSKLPAAKDQPVVFYSDGPSGWKSYKAAVTAVKAGHKNVSYMRAGWTEWSAKGFPTE